MSESILDQVRRQYSAVAVQGLSSDHAGVRRVAEAFGYSAQELASIPAEANMGLSCGNPTATAGLRPGEVVLDLVLASLRPSAQGRTDQKRLKQVLKLEPEELCRQQACRSGCA